MTLIVVVIFALGLVVYDVWTGFKNGANTTISWQIYVASQSYPIIAFTLGVIMGHLFWVQHGG